MTKNIITLVIAGVILSLSTAIANARTESSIFNQNAAFPAFPDNG